ncbi:hypothetical protein [Flavobacterium sp.]|uniref:hypothetical protein n=1 Tax=Flavobacterium sp. TaxID=239 RepID=UPI0012064C12|nr:hypothetical protein [Flavobacterium sp.]RZJ70376.1 MAG: hypothetical protein EOO49_13925 [Flavobacterium sp.]
MKQIRRLFLALLLVFSLNANSCTVFSWAMKGEVFAAANEDDYTPFTRIWFNPATAERFGSVCFGAPDLQIAAAMNEYGLFYDYTAQYGVDLAKIALKNPYQGDLFFEIIGKCKTVAEALEMLKTHDYSFTSQVLLADATGNSVIINPGNITPKTGNFQISTNFNICDLKTGYKCDRYDTADRILSNAKVASVKTIESVLNFTHQEGNLSTQYSAIYDLKRLKIKVFLFHNFEEAFEIDLKSELSKGYRLELLSRYFSPTFAYTDYVSNHELFKKETLLSEIEKVGYENAKEHYLSVARNSQDPKEKTAILDIAIQLIRDANNEHSNGKVWAYWFGFPDGFNPKKYSDKRLDMAKTLLLELSKSESDAKTRHFEFEMIAYLNWLRDEMKNAAIFYRKAIENPADSYPVSYNRSVKMLANLE